MHTPPFVIDQTELSFTFLSPTTTVRFASFSFAYNCLHRGKAEGGLGEGRGGIGRLERVRASDRSGISVRAQFFFRRGRSARRDINVSHTLSDCSEWPFRRAGFVDLSLSLPPVR